jgi:hypothetical protein
LTKGRDMPLVVPIAPMWINAERGKRKDYSASLLQGESVGSRGFAGRARTQARVTVIVATGKLPNAGSHGWRSSTFVRHAHHLSVAGNNHLAATSSEPMTWREFGRKVVREENFRG